MAMWAWRRELTTEFPFCQWRYITRVCGQNEGRKVRPQRESDTSDLFSFVFFLIFPTFSIVTDSSSVILRSKSLRQGERNYSSSHSSLLHPNQNLPAAREAHWNEGERWSACTYISAHTQPSSSAVSDWRLHLNQRWVSPSAPSTFLAVRHVLEKTQTVIVSEQTLPLRLSVGQLSWAVNMFCDLDQKH